LPRGEEGDGWVEPRAAEGFHIFLSWPSIQTAVKLYEAEPIAVRRASTLSADGDAVHARKAVTHEGNSQGLLPPQVVSLVSQLQDEYTGKVEQTFA
jgi:hypothetical protein